MQLSYADAIRQANVVQCPHCSAFANPKDCCPQCGWIPTQRVIDQFPWAEGVDDDADVPADGGEAAYQAALDELVIGDEDRGERGRVIWDRIADLKRLASGVVPY